MKKKKRKHEVRYRFFSFTHKWMAETLRKNEIFSCHVIFLLKLSFIFITARLHLVDKMCFSFKKKTIFVICLVKNILLQMLIK